MAPTKTYVEVRKMAVKDVFDDKYKSSIPAILKKVAEKAIKGDGKLTLDAPKDKGAKGWTLDGTLVSLGPDKAGKKLAGEVSLVISTWPGKSIKAMPGGKAAIGIDGPDKIAAGDVQALVEALMSSAMDTATGYMEKNAP